MKMMFEDEWVNCPGSPLPPNAQNSTPCRRHACGNKGKGKVSGSDQMPDGPEYHSQAVVSNSGVWLDHSSDRIIHWPRDPARLPRVGTRRSMSANEGRPCACGETWKFLSYVHQPGTRLFACQGRPRVPHRHGTSAMTLDGGSGC